MCGIMFHDLAPHITLNIFTVNSRYTLVRDILFGGTIRGGTLKGGGTRYPSWQAVRVAGAKSTGCPLRYGFIGKNMHLEFIDLSTNQIITTSYVRSIVLVYACGRTFHI